MKKKNIDELFKERFNDFDEIPDPKVWSNIEKSLEKKESKKVIPIWWKLGGVAAVLAILFYLVNPFENISNNAIEVTNTEKQSKESIENGVNGIKTTKEEGYSNSESPKNNVLEHEKELQENVSGSPSYVQENNSSEENKTSNPKTNAKNQNKQLLNTVNNAIVQQDKKQKADRKTSSIAKNVLQNQGQETSGLNVPKSQNGMAVNESEKEKTLGKNPEKLSNTIQENTVVKETSQNAIAEVDKKKQSYAQKLVEKKKSILEEIEKEDKALAENKSNKWSVGPSVAPVYFNAIGKGSPIHSSFTPNSKSGDVNLSYGVSVAYELSKKLKVRSGVYKVDYGYNTNDVAFTSSFSPNATVQIANINYKSTSKSIVVESTAVEQDKSLSPSFASDVSAKSAALEGSLAQQFGYIEVPFELNYALIDKKFGVNLIGGMSSLFLVNNDVLLNSGDQTTEMGEANNINSVNFSTNFGFGINYKFTPKLQFNVEPVFKYQLNTFSNSAGNFQPFSVGVYSGINFRF